MQRAVDRLLAFWKYTVTCLTHKSNDNGICMSLGQSLPLPIHRGQDLQSSQSNRLKMHFLVYDRIKTKNTATIGDTKAAVMTIHAIESGLSKFGVTAGGGGHAPTISLEFIVDSSLLLARAQHFHC